MKIGVYPGSFDPITNGHLDVIERASKIFDEVIVLIAINNEKKSFFNVEERIEMIKESTKHMKNVKVDSYNGLTMRYAKKVNAIALIRGLRVVSDFEYEWKLAAANEFIDNSIEMIFFMAKKETSFISSSSIKELYQNQVDISSLVPKSVIEMLKNKKI